jgi:hypothetical protein
VLRWSTTRSKALVDMCSHLFCRQKAVSEIRVESRGNTYDQDNIRVTCLHLSSRRCILVPSEIFSINNSDYGIEFEVPVSFTFELTNLECECCRECRTAKQFKCKVKIGIQLEGSRAFYNDPIRAIFLWKAEIQSQGRPPNNNGLSLPRISNNAVFICPTRTQHLIFKHLNRHYGEENELYYMHPFSISLTAVRLDCFASWLSTRRLGERSKRNQQK